MVAIILYYYIYLIIYRGKTKTYRREGRERTRAKDAAAIAPATRTRGRAATSSASGRSHRPPSPPIQRQGSASGCRSSCPSRPRPLPLCHVVRVGRRASQGGRSPPAHPVDPLHPAGGAGRIYPDGSRRGEGGKIPVWRRSLPCESKFSG